MVLRSGMGYLEVRQVALDVFRANFLELTGMARQVAGERAEEITESFLSKLQHEHPEGFDQATDPGFQHALFTVQKEHARTGDKDLADLLVDLLVDRTKHPQRDILQIVLDESLNTAPKLTEGQLANLAVIFQFKYTQTFGIGSHARLGEHFDKFVQAFAPKLVKGAASFQHLEFTGCGSSSMMQSSLEQGIGGTYQGLFLKGFDTKELEDRGLPAGAYRNLFLPCLNDQNRLQVNAINHTQLENLLSESGASTEDAAKIKALFDLNKMNDEEIRAKCIEIRGYMESVFEAWSTSQMKNFTLTSVGIAIGHANIKRLAGEFADLSIWIN